jgi:acyl carrier protein
MKKNNFLRHLEKIFELKKNSVNEKTTLKNVKFDSLKVLELMAFNDANFKGLKIPPNKISKCKDFNELIKLYGTKIS